MIPASVRQAIVIRFSTVDPLSVRTIAEVCLQEHVCAFRNGLCMPAATDAGRLGARALYVGLGFGLSPQRNAVAVLAVGLDGRLELAKDARDPGKGFYSCRTALIEPTQLLAGAPIFVEG
jgi:hypothetical protein